MFYHTFRSFGLSVSLLSRAASSLNLFPLLNPNRAMAGKLTLAINSNAPQKPTSSGPQAAADREIVISRKQ
uniref:Putative secreted protein n=1 Tax=Anopheles marajoara TaxID=58244 RepID=A0A2M4CEG4_9DIPT